MAIVNNSLKGLSGTLNNLVFCQRNGVTYVRTRPARYRDAKSDSQLLARGRFTGCNRFYDYLKDSILKQVWRAAALGTGKNGKNLFVQQNIHAFDRDGIVLDFSRLHFSTGLLPLPDHLRLSCLNRRDCIVEWDMDPKKTYGSLTDKLYIAEIRRGAEKTPVIRALDARREDCKAAFSTETDIDKHTHFYCFWGNAADTSFSVTHYFREIELSIPDDTESAQTPDVPKRTAHIEPNLADSSPIATLPIHPANKNNKNKKPRSP